MGYVILCWFMTFDHRLAICKFDCASAEKDLNFTQMLNLNQSIFVTLEIREIRLI